ncbi:MAG: YARHG domain-containing protein [Lachnospiraceae bacterium]|nr:YARHG domain-containing protein [Lachnospiraceae bacterium]
MKRYQKITSGAGALLVLLAFLAVFSAVHAATSYASEQGISILPDSSRIYYQFSDIEDMPVQVVCYAKNEIYARNGRMFVSEELRNYFLQQAWYRPAIPADEFANDRLNAYEQANVDLLSRRESELGGYITDGAAYSYDVVYAYVEGQVTSSSHDEYYVDPESSIFPESSRRYIENRELSELSLQELCYARNEIYARHGVMFSSLELSDYFSQKNWYWGYISPGEFSEGSLNEFERANVQSLYTEEMSRAPGGYQLDQSYTYDSIGTYRNSGSVADAAGETWEAPVSEYIFEDSDSRYLTMDDISGLTLQMVCYARNEIYARRGYIFQSQELRDYFASKSWYHGTTASSQFSSSIFNTYELANIDLLKNYEYGTNPNGYQLY